MYIQYTLIEKTLETAGPIPLNAWHVYVPPQ